VSFIGCDIVDLQHFSRFGLQNRRAYFDRCYTEQEACCKDDNQLAAAFWAAKESAFKVHFKSGYQVSFCPNSFECRLVSTSDDLLQKEYQIIVRNKRNAYFVEAHQIGDQVYSIAGASLTHLKRCRSVVLDGSTESTGSRHAHILLRQLMTEYVEPEGQLHLSKNSSRPYPEVPDPVANYIEDCSISHDGRYVMATLFERDSHV
jgi:phosphopantetheinyl transferase (holo-ACP synthase)